jgi:hypothetical protein
MVLIPITWRDIESKSHRLHGKDQGRVGQVVAQKAAIDQ